MIGTWGWDMFDFGQEKSDVFFATQINSKISWQLLQTLLSDILLYITSALLPVIDFVTKFS